MKIIIGLLVAALLLAGGYYFFHSGTPEVAEDGLVSFSFRGKRYEIPHIVFFVQPEALVSESFGREVKSINKGSPHSFGFELALTSSAANQSKKLAFDDPKQQWFSAYWYVTTTDPEGLLSLSPKMSSKDHTPSGVEDISLTFRLPSQHVASCNPNKYDCWVQIDSLASNRVRGRFGGTFVVGASDDSAYDIVDGSFDVPYQRLYKYK
ncbi:MAG: hypothetical protein HYZ51_04725 [Candidatus Doudnabacteria bacterium]|nr:hypothetical protein [Candidatus Doudnabacteria bacterium]